jgi:uncharacterized RDD family membrane protein YckC
MKTEKNTTNKTSAFIPAHAGFRFLDYILDILFYIVVAIVMVIVAVFVKVFTKIDLFPSVNGLGNFLRFVALWYVYLFLYYFIQEYFFNRTFAKALTGTQVITESGNKPGAVAVAIRTLCRAIPFNEFSIFFNNKRTWHDSISKTVVVKTKTLPKKQQRKGKVMLVVAILMCATTVGLWMLWPLYEKLTGGERIDISTHIPKDLSLVEYKQIDGKSVDYYSMTYEGETRKIKMNRLIAGFNFQPENKCIHMHPTKGDYGADLVAQELLCVEVAAKERGVRVYKVSGFENNASLAEVAPHYIIYKPPFRYGIQFLKGSLTKEEVILMSTDFKTYNAEELKRLAAQGRAKMELADPNTIKVLDN